MCNSSAVNGDGGKWVPFKQRRALRAPGRRDTRGCSADERANTRRGLKQDAVAKQPLPDPPPQSSGVPNVDLN